MIIILQTNRKSHILLGHSFPTTITNPINPINPIKHSNSNRHPYVFITFNLFINNICFFSEESFIFQIVIPDTDRAIYNLYPFLLNNFSIFFCFFHCYFSGFLFTIIRCSKIPSLSINSHIHTIFFTYFCHILIFRRFIKRSFQL